MSVRLLCILFLHLHTFLSVLEWMAASILCSDFGLFLIRICYCLEVICIVPELIQMHSYAYLRPTLAAEWSWCFSCQEESHWPCSCSIAQWYAKWKAGREQVHIDKDAIRKLIIKSYEWIKTFSKLCPGCNKPIEKNGGTHTIATCGWVDRALLFTVNIVCMMTVSQSMERDRPVI